MKLQTYLSAENISIAAFGRRIGVKGRRTMHRIARGAVIPRPETMRSIYVETAGAVAPNDFYDLPDLAALAESPEPQGSAP